METKLSTRGELLLNANKIQKKLIVLLLMVFISSCGAPAAVVPAARTTIASDLMADTIAKYRQEIPKMMQQANIPGLAIAIVDDKSILWMEGFGYTDWNRRIPVTQDTLFSIQSMSKSFTATAAMFAAQDGLVDLDAPITDYLPNFRVNSIFEDHPEQKITLRMLLSHTAGFAHEAPYGGNFDLPAYSFEKHIASISDTWLKFPVGAYYSYSNLGIDLAGYILQVRSGMPFIQYVQEKVLQPLGMKDSTLDVQQVRASTTRAIGHAGVPLPPPVDFLLIPSGGVWTTAADMARYLQFHINEGAIDGRRLLQEDLAETMYTPPNTVAEIVGYGLGIDVSIRNGARHFQHGGGGFGFNSSMVWYPDLKLGSVVLTNAEPTVSYAYNLSEGVLDSMIARSPELYAQRAENSNAIEPAYLPADGETPLTNHELRNLIRRKALPDDTSAVSRRINYAGEYIIQSFGMPGDTVEVSYANGELSCAYLGEVAALTEVEPGLFFSPSGVALDLQGPDLSFNNIHMVKADSRIMWFRIVIYSVCGLIFLSTLLLWPIRALISGMRRKRAGAGSATTTVAGRWKVWAWGLIALASLFGLFCVMVILIIPNMVYFSWPRPYPELAFWQQLLIRLPYISLTVAGMAALLTGLALKNHSLEHFMRLYFLIAILVLLVFNIALLV
ncbi:MAG TPA: serine hydrolase [Anaerolineales bacterium]|nr:serine hydrolase [Anaerolineales bacterium]